MDIGHAVNMSYFGSKFSSIGTDLYKNLLTLEYRKLLILE